MQKIAGPGDERIPNDIVHDEAAYLAEFAHLPAGLAHVVDVSPSYLQEPAAAARIHAFAPDARIVILLASRPPRSCRNTPISGPRAARPCRSTPPSPRARRRARGFSTMFDYEAGGRYAEAVERYLSSSAASG